MTNENRTYRPSNASAIQRLGNHSFDAAARRVEPNEEILYQNLKRQLESKGIKPSYEDWVAGLAKAERNHSLLIRDPDALERANAAIHRLLDRVHGEFYPDEKGGE